MDIDNLSRKAVILYGYVQGCGGGALDEWQLRDKTGLSHGSICAARKELVEAGLLTLGKEGRKMIYQLTGQAGPLEADASEKPAPVPPVVPPPPAPKATVVKSALTPVQEADMPRVTGTFESFDDWMATLTMELGGCVNVSESLVTPHAYIVYAEDYGQEDHYQVTENEDGGVDVY